MINWEKTYHSFFDPFLVQLLNSFFYFAFIKYKYKFLLRFSHSLDIIILHFFIEISSGRSTSS